ncbi:hypothetical protein C8R47DRAFT_1069596 [Mycena vitilis]|nr:hypothetical protein C8R47DRAFT_1069596 [Mycena vitilis]
MALESGGNKGRTVDEQDTGTCIRWTDGGQQIRRPEEDGSNGDYTAEGEPCYKLPRPQRRDWQKRAASDDDRMPNEKPARNGENAHKMSWPARSIGRPLARTRAGVLREGPTEGNEHKMEVHVCFYREEPRQSAQKKKWENDLAVWVAASATAYVARSFSTPPTHTKNLPSFPNPPNPHLKKMNIPESVLSDPRFTAAVQAHQALMQTHQYAASPSFPGAFEWRPWKSGGSVLRERRLPGVIPGPSTPMEQFAYVTVVARVGEFGLEVAPTANFRAGYASAVGSKYYLPLLRPNHPVWGPAYDAALVNMHGVEAQKCPNGSVHMFRIMYGEEAMRLGKKLFEPKGDRIEVDARAWPIPPEMRAKFAEALVKHDLRVLPVYGKDGNLVAPAMIPKVLAGALTKNTYRVFHYEIRDRDTGEMQQSMTGEVVQVEVYEEASPPPPTLFGLGGVGVGHALTPVPQSLQQATAVSSNNNGSQGYQHQNGLQQARAHHGPPIPQSYPQQTHSFPQQTQAFQQQAQSFPHQTQSFPHQSDQTHSGPQHGRSFAQRGSPQGPHHQIGVQQTQAHHTPPIAQAFPQQLQPLPRHAQSLFPPPGQALPYQTPAQASQHLAPAFSHQAPSAGQQSPSLLAPLTSQQQASTGTGQTRRRRNGAAAGTGPVAIHKSGSRRSSTPRGAGKQQLAASDRSPSPFVQPPPGTTNALSSGAHGLSPFAPPPNSGPTGATYNIPGGPFAHGWDARKLTFSNVVPGPPGPVSPFGTQRLTAGAASAGSGAGRPTATPLGLPNTAPFVRSPLSQSTTRPYGPSAAARGFASGVGPVASMPPSTQTDVGGVGDGRNTTKGPEKGPENITGTPSAPSGTSAIPGANTVSRAKTPTPAVAEELFPASPHTPPNQSLAPYPQTPGRDRPSSRLETPSSPSPVGMQATRTPQTHVATSELWPAPLDSLPPNSGGQIGQHGGGPMWSGAPGPLFLDGSFNGPLDAHQSGGETQYHTSPPWSSRVTDTIKSATPLFLGAASPSPLSFDFGLPNLEADESVRRESAGEWDMGPRLGDVGETFGEMDDFIVADSDGSGEASGEGSGDGASEGSDGGESLHSAFTHSSDTSETSGVPYPSLDKRAAARANLEAYKQRRDGKRKAQSKRQGAYSDDECTVKKARNVQRLESDDAADDAADVAAFARG